MRKGKTFLHSRVSILYTYRLYTQYKTRCANLGRKNVYLRNVFFFVSFDCWWAFFDNDWNKVINYELIVWHERRFRQSIKFHDIRNRISPRKKSWLDNGNWLIIDKLFPFDMLENIDGLVIQKKNEEQKNRGKRFEHSLQ